SYTLEDGTSIPQLKSDNAGERIQLVGTAGFALEVGTQLYAYDLPKSYLLGIEEGPYSITTANNRVKLDVIGTAETEQGEFSVPVGSQDAATLAAVIDAAGTVAGTTYFNSFAMTIPGGESHVVISAENDFDILNLLG